MHYLLIYDLVDDYLERRGQYRDEHLRLTTEASERGELLVGGALADPADRAILMFQGDTPEVAAKFARADPYVTDGLVTSWTVREWTTVAGELAATPVVPSTAAPRRAKVTRVAPVLLAKDVVAAAKFWEEKLGFQVELFGAPTNFAMVGRGGVTVMLAQVPHGATFTPNWRIADKTNNAYIWVDDARAMYAEVQERGAPIDFTLYDTPWGTREFGVQDLDDHDIAFGQVL